MVRSSNFKESVTTQGKVTTIQREPKHLHSKSEVSIQNLATFVGMTAAAKQAILVAPLFHRHLQALINSVVPLEVGKHPLVTRMLKGVFNERPPRPKFESVWKVDQVLMMFNGHSASLSL